MFVEHINFMSHFRVFVSEFTSTIRRILCERKCNVMSHLYVRNNKILKHVRCRVESNFCQRMKLKKKNRMSSVGSHALSMRKSNLKFKLQNESADLKVL